MLQKKLDKIELADLERLLGVAREGKTLEFKQVIPAKSDRKVLKIIRSLQLLIEASADELTGPS